MGLHFYHRSRNHPNRTEVNLEEIYSSGDDYVRRWAAESRGGCAVIFHGFASSSSASWIADLEQALLKLDDLDVFTVDWSQGAAGPNYFQAVANTRVVATLVARFLRKLVERKWCSSSNLHLIGQSLGAHLASYVATNLTNVAEITGLDPAQPWFENNAVETHLDPSDAQFVQVVHTNVLPFWPSFGLGISKPTETLQNIGDKTAGWTPANRWVFSRGFFPHEAPSIFPPTTAFRSAGKKAATTKGS
uniref:Pancreatic lipase-related protein 2 n=1 Tax=Lygus hesperus TaxID=30085 RepID=A0A0A9YJS7_LYGHE